MVSLLFIVGALLSVLVQCDLKSDRLTNAQLWIERARSSAQTQGAYAPTVVNFSTIYHRVNYAGNFGPGLLALEYDAIVNNLVFITGFNPVQLRPTWDLSTTRWIAEDILRVDYNLGISAGKFTPEMLYMFDQEDFRFVEYIVYDVNSALINTGFTVQDKGADTLFTITSGAIPVEIICGGFIFGACGQINPATNQSYIAETGFTDVVDCITSLSIINGQPQPCPFPQRSNTLACRALHGISSFFIPAVHCSHVKKDSPVCRAQCLPACANCHANATCQATYAADFPFNKASYSPIYKCVCANGYTGDGLNCAPISCTPSTIGGSNRSARVCPTEVAGSAECVDSLCKCKNSFSHQPTQQDDYCGCAKDTVLRYINKQPICVPIGRCLSDSERYMCDLQNHNHVKCVAVNNTFNPFGACRCNPGFQGGMEYPCRCETGKRIVWSNSVDGSVCLASNECTANSDCASSATCQLTADKYIGLCSTQ